MDQPKEVITLSSLCAMYDGDTWVGVGLVDEYIHLIAGQVKAGSGYREKGSWTNPRKPLLDDGGSDDDF